MSLSFLCLSLFLVRIFSSPLPRIHRKSQGDQRTNLQLYFGSKRYVGGLFAEEFHFNCCCSYDTDISVLASDYAAVSSNLGLTHINIKLDSNGFAKTHICTID
jgi:hypothetical protein